MLHFLSLPASFLDLVDQLNDVDRRIRQIDAHLAAICRKNEACRRLVGMPGVGPIVATALVAAIADGRQFRSGRDYLAAWIRAGAPPHKPAASQGLAALAEEPLTDRAARLCMERGP